MMREGYAAVTSRRVEAEAGLKLHYHFATLDDLFIAVVALNTAPNVAGAFGSGGVLGILAIGVTAALVPPAVAWFVGLKLLKLNPAVLMGALCGARFCTPALRAAQEETGSAVPAVGYPVPYAITAVLVLIGGYVALFL